MGYDSTEFIGLVLEKFYCSICDMILEDPVEMECRDIFCIKCVLKWISHNRLCPVDFSPLTISGLKTPSSYYRRLLNDLQKKCNFHLQGCIEIVRLEHIQDHLSKCMYNPSSEIILKNGCNLQMSTLEYETHNCTAHASGLVSRLEERITKQNREIGDLNNSTNELMELVCRLEEKINEKNAELSGLQKCLQRQQKYNENLYNEVRCLRKQIPTFNAEMSRQNMMQLYDRQQEMVIDNVSLKWLNFYNVKTSSDQTNIFTVGHKSTWALAQSFYYLEPSNYYFKVQILECGGCVIGLSSARHPTNFAPGWFEGSVGYYYTGAIRFNNIREIIGTAWEHDEIIECGITFPPNFFNDGNQNVNVYFLRNGKFVAEKQVTMPHDGLFPTVYIFGTDVKVKYLAE